MHDISSDCSRTSASGDAINAMVDAAYRGHVDRRRFMKILIAAGVSAAVARDMAEQAAQAQSNQAVQLANLRSEYDYIVVGAGAMSSASQPSRLTSSQSANSTTGVV